MNRNRNQRRGMRERQQIKPKPVNNLSALGKNNLPEVLTKEWQDMLTLAKQKPIYALVSVIAGIASIIALMEFFSKYVLNQGSGGIDSNSYSPGQGGLISGLLSFFPGRIMAFLILTLSLSWIISLIGILLTKTPTDIKTIIAHLVTAMGAIIMVLCIDIIFFKDIVRAPFFGFLIAILGVTLAIFIAKTNFQQQNISNQTVTATQAGLLMNFSTVAAILVVFSKVVGLS